VQNVARAGYVIKRLCLNTAAPLTQRIRGRGPLGIDGDMSRVAATLDWFAAPLRAIGYRAEGTHVLELGPGKTCEVLAAFVLAGARSGLGLDYSLDVPATVSPARLRATAQVLETTSSGFFDAVANSAGIVHQRCEAIVASEEAALKFERYNGWSIPLADHSVDLIVSRSVLEHVNQTSVIPLLRELRRVLRPDGGMVHLIDMRDHMHLTDNNGVTSGPSFSDVKGDWLDALTYSEWLYRAMFSRSPAMINRIRIDEWLSLFTQNGFKIIQREDYRLALPQSATNGTLREPWRSLDPNLLAVAQVSLALR
jgi:SAM-dependent methyltransferase